MSSKSEKKLAHRRLQMLEFAETLGNVSEACHKMGLPHAVLRVQETVSGAGA